MLTCALCQKLFNSISLFCTHLRNGCPFNSTNCDSVKFSCGVSYCRRHFTTLHALRAHLKKCAPERGLSEDDNGNNVIPEAIAELNPVFEQDVSSETANTANLVKESLQKLVIGLYSNPSIPRSSIQIIVSNIEQFLTSYNNSLGRVISLMVESGIPTSLFQSYVRDLFVASEIEMSDLNSEHKRIQNLQVSGSLVMPIEVPIGTRLELPRKGVCQSPCTLQLVPIDLVLGKLLSVDHIYKGFSDYFNNINMPFEQMTNIVHGQNWQSKKFTQSEHELNLPLILYFDDFEVNNPLGSHVGIQKLGGVYLGLPFLPPYWVSQLNNIMMLAVFHASDRRNFGNRAIFQPIIKKLNHLSKNGITVSNEYFQGVVKFHIAGITGDNLGLNGILGFVESFISNSCCRVCSVEKSQLVKMHTLDTNLLRNMDSYKRDLESNNCKKTGIKEKCVWFDMDGFSLFDTVSVDILHDYLEGCCRYVISYLVNYVVKVKKFVSLQVLQKKIFYFDYGPDRTNKPSNILFDDGTATIKLKCSGSEMLVFVKYFGVIVGYYVPEDDRVWGLYILLRKLLDTLMVRSFDQDDYAPLKHLIELFLWSYCDIVGETLKPKFHFLLHYPDMFLKFGPLIYLSTMRFEAKHRVSKIAARAACNRMNICKTVAVRNQLTFHNHLLVHSKFERVVFGKKKSDISSQILDTLMSVFNIRSPDLIFSIKWLEIEGDRIHVSSVLMKDICSETMLPIFVQVEDIFVYEGQFFLFCSQLISEDFIEHFQSYEIHKSEEQEYLSLESLFSPTPHTLSIQPDFKFFVTLRHKL